MNKSKTQQNIKVIFKSKESKNKSKKKHKKNIIAYTI